jgi:hypothetical protein
MHVGRSLVALWAPLAAALGPVISQRHGVTQYLGGAVAISAPFAAAWVCHQLDDRRAGQPSYAVVRSGPAPYVGFVVGLLLVLGAYGNAERVYSSLFTYPASVQVIGSGCYEVGSSCVEYAILADAHGVRLPLELYDVAGGRRAGDAITVRWDKLNYASPIPMTYPGTSDPYLRSPAPVPVFALPVIGAVYIGVIGYYTRRGWQRRRAATAAAVQARPRLANRVTQPLRRRPPAGAAPGVRPRGVPQPPPPARLGGYPTRRPGGY